MYLIMNHNLLKNLKNDFIALCASKKYETLKTSQTLTNVAKHEIDPFNFSK